MIARNAEKPVRSIKSRLIFPLVGVLSVSILVMAGFLVLITRYQGQNATEISAKALRAQAESYLVQLNQAGAQENNLILERVQQDAEKLATYTAGLFDHPEAFTSQAYWNMDDHMVQGAAGQYYSKKDEDTSAFVPNNQVINDQVRRDLETSAYMDFIFKAVYENDSYVDAIYFGTANNVIRYYPNVGLGEALPPDFRATDRVWYTQSILENDPQKTSWWTPVYTNGAVLVTTAAAPVYTEKQEFIGVVGLDIQLNELATQIEAERFLGSGYTFLIDPSGKAIALPAQGHADLLNRNPEQGETGVDLSGISNEFKPVISEMRAGKTGVQTLQVNGNELLVAYAPVEATGWSHGSVVKSQDVIQAIGGLGTDLNQSTQGVLLRLVLPVGVVLLILAGLTGWIIADRIAKPVQKLAQAALQMGTGQPVADLPVRDQDEIGVLAREMQSMAIQQQSSVASLEERLADQAKDLECRTAELQVAAQVAQATTTDQNLDKLLQDAAGLIQEQFGFYHTGIYLLDENREFATLKAAAGEAWQELLHQKRQVRLGNAGVVASASETGQAQLSSDVDADPAFLRDPLLPETRSEAVVPFKVAGQTIGLLDIQSAETAAFDHEEIRIFQMLADQLAIAIQNAFLTAGMKESLGQAGETAPGYTQSSWRKIIQQRGAKTGYIYRDAGLYPATKQPEEAAAAIQTGKTILLNGTSENHAQSQPALAVPLKVRDQVIGAIDIKFDGQALPPEVISTFEEIAGRLSLALESSRLLEETQIRTEQLYLLQEITAAAASHIKMDELLQEVVELVRKGFGFSRCSVVLFDARQKSAAFVCEAIENPFDPRRTPTWQPIPIPDVSVFDAMILTKRTTVLYDFPHHPQAGSLDPSVQQDEFATLLLCPLQARGEASGAILMETTDPKRIFTAEDLQLLDQIGLQVSVALDVVRMFEQTQLRAEREKMIAEVNSRVRASTNVDVILQTSITELARILHVKKGSIQLQTSKGRAE